MKTLLCAVALFATLAITAASAATYHWTLAKSGHHGLQTSSMKNVNGIAISAVSNGATFKLNWRVSCVRGSAVSITQGSFTTHGQGTKVPVKVGLASPNSCSVDVSDVALKVGQTKTVSIWRR